MDNDVKNNEYRDIDYKFNEEEALNTAWKYI